MAEWVVLKKNVFNSVSQGFLGGLIFGGAGLEMGWLGESKIEGRWIGLEHLIGAV